MSGDCCATQVIELAFNPPDIPDGMDDDIYVTTIFLTEVRTSLAKHKQSRGTLSMLIAGRGKFWHMDSTFSVTRSRSPFTAASSGGNLALGAMHVSEGVEPRKRILAALRAAERWTDSVLRPFLVRKI